MTFGRADIIRHLPIAEEYRVLPRDVSDSSENRTTHKIRTYSTLQYISESFSARPLPSDNRH